MQNLREKGLAQIWKLLIFLGLILIGWMGFQFLIIPIKHYEIKKKADEKIRYEDREVIKTKLKKYLHQKGIMIDTADIHVFVKGKGQNEEIETGDSLRVEFEYSDSCYLLGVLLPPAMNIKFVFHHKVDLRNIRLEAELRH